MKKFNLLCLPYLILFVSGCLTSTPLQSARVVEPGQQSASASLQRSVDYEDDNDFGWYMMEYAGRFPVANGRMDFSVGGAVMVMEDENGLGGAGAMFGLGTKIELIQNILAIGRMGGNIVRPEIGVLIFPEGHNVLQFGIGFTPESPTRAGNSRAIDITPY